MDIMKSINQNWVDDKYEFKSDFIFHKIILQMHMNISSIYC